VTLGGGELGMRDEGVPHDGLKGLDERRLEVSGRLDEDSLVG
jgi:hypothetical protein